MSERRKMAYLEGDFVLLRKERDSFEAERDQAEARAEKAEWIANHRSHYVRKAEAELSELRSVTEKLIREAIDLLERPTEHDSYEEWEEDRIAWIDSARAVLGGIDE